jgi:hypothetical protein
MRIPVLFTRLSLLCAGAGLLGCAPIGGRVVLDGGVPAADEAYLAGRNLHLARRYDEARAAYQAALQAAPQHVNARNGLATLYAEQREFATAIALWRALTESLDLASGPGKAYLLSNLGHAYFLSGDYDNALVALEKACLLDPLNHRPWQLLGESLRKLGQEERARQMLAQAEALRAHDLRADYAAAGGQSQVAAIDRALKAPARDEPGWGQVQLYVGADGMLELRRGEVVATPPAAPLPLPAAPDGLPAAVLVEVRNGNGVTGMARQLARQIGTGSLKVTRLSNQPGFGVRRTRIEFEPAQRAAAERLAGRFDGVQLQEVASCAPARIRVVLGRDLVRSGGRGLVLRPAPDSAPVTAALDVNKAD